MVSIELTHQRISENPEAFYRFVDPSIKLRRVGPNELRAGSKGALSITERSGISMFYDHEAGIGGDALAFYRLKKGCDNKAAIAACAAWAGVADNERPPLPRAIATAKPEKAPFVLNAAQLARATAAAARLGTDAALCAKIAAQRDFKPETIKRLAHECALGWDENRLSFIYETGIKHRWEVNGERRIAWAVGNGSSFWRGHMRQREATKRAIICEGETDCIRLLDLGLETAGTVIYAVASASTWPADWRRAIVGLDEVTFALDADKAGQAHISEWADLIRSKVGTVRTVNWQEVLK